VVKKEKGGKAREGCAWEIRTGKTKPRQRPRRQKETNTRAGRDTRSREAGRKRGLFPFDVAPFTEPTIQGKGHLTEKIESFFHVS
jgi:hypothetical protein